MRNKILNFPWLMLSVSLIVGFFVFVFVCYVIFENVVESPNFEPAQHVIDSIANIKVK